VAIQIIDLHKSFGEKKVLHGIDYVFEDRKVNMIIGASGSGKTVLLRCMVGLLKPERGAVIYDGMNLATISYPEKRSLHQKIGMLFQSSALFDSMTVGENIGFPLRMFSGLSGKSLKERVEYCLERVKMPGTAHLYPSEISGGMKKRVGIARAIALNPKYLFCDEPNSGLDPKTAEVIDRLILDITQEFGTTTVVVTHDMKSVLSIADRVMFIYKGHKEWEGERADILNAQSEVLIDFIKTSGLLD
jgi:phospholipid/cholesterol/gamma-HCH transport system ATP-binding protein